MYLHDSGDCDGNGETGGNVSECASPDFAFGGWTWAKTTFGKGLDAGIVREIGGGVGDNAGRLMWGSAEAGEM